MVVPKLHQCPGCKAYVTNERCARCRAQIEAERQWFAAAGIMRYQDQVTVDQALALADLENRIIYGVPGGAVPRGILNAQ